MESVIRFAIVGVGGAGDVHAQVIKRLPNAELAAVIGRNENTGKEFAKKYDCKYYSSCMDAINNEDFSVAAICTPSSTHCGIALDFARAAKHVIIEKPLDIDLEAIDRLNKEANSKRIKVCTVFQHRFDECTIKAKKAINEGRLGKLFYAACHVKSYRDQNYYDNTKWRGTWTFDGGGALMIQAIHSIDLLLYLMGDIHEVYGYCGTFAHERIEVEDLGIAAIKFKNGGLGLVDGTTAAYPGLYRSIDVYGENGSMSILNDKLVTYKVKDMVLEEEEYMLACEVDTPDFNTAFINSLERQYVDMINAIENDSEPLVNGKEGRKSVEIVLSIYKSNNTNTPVLIL